MDDLSEPFWVCTRVTHQLARPPHAAVEQTNRPIAEEIAAKPDFVPAVMVPAGVVGLQRNGKQVVHRSHSMSLICPRRFGFPLPPAKSGSGLSPAYFLTRRESVRSETRHSLAMAARLSV